MEHARPAFLLVALLIAQLVAHVQCLAFHRSRGPQPAATTADSSPHTRENIRQTETSSRSVPSGRTTWPLRETIAIATAPDTPKDFVKQVCNTLKDDGFSVATVKDRSSSMRTIHGYRAAVSKHSGGLASMLKDFSRMKKHEVDCLAGFSYAIDEHAKELLEVPPGSNEGRHSLTQEPPDGSRNIGSSSGRGKDMITWLSFYCLAPDGDCGDSDGWFRDYSFDGIDGVTFVYSPARTKPKLDTLREAGFEIAEGEYSPDFSGRHIFAYRPGMEDIKDHYDILWDRAKAEPFSPPRNSRGLQCTIATLPRASFEKAVQSCKKRGG